MLRFDFDAHKMNAGQTLIKDVVNYSSLGIVAADGANADSDTKARHSGKDGRGNRVRCCSDTNRPPNYDRSESPDVPSHKTGEAPKGLLRHRRTTGHDFWKKKLRDAEDLKTRQAEYNEAVPTNPKVIFYESMSGARMMDSPYALFARIYDDPAFREYHYVWSVRAQDLVPDELKAEPRITFVTRNTDAHMYFLALAGSIIGNSLLPDHFVRKADQKYLNTWHGIAYKALGRTEDSPLGAAGSVYNLLQATHVLTPCPFMTETELSRFSLRGVFSGSMAEIGYPRQDLTMTMRRNGQTASGKCSDSTLTRRRSFTHRPGAETRAQLVSMRNSSKRTSTA